MRNFVKSFLVIQIDGIKTSTLKLSENSVYIINQLADWIFSGLETELFGMKKVSKILMNKYK